MCYNMVIELEPRMNCPLDAAMSVIEGRWKSTILCLLAVNGSMRFNRLLDNIGCVSPGILTKQLRELEKDGIIVRSVYAEVPTRVEYDLTEMGWTLAPLLKSMSEWGLKYIFKNKVIFDEGIILPVSIDNKVQQRP